VITTLILRFLGAILTFALGLFPAVAKPAWWTDISSFIATGVNSANAFANYLPITAIKYALVFLLLCYSVAFIVKVILRGVSVLTGGGGGA
jgi:hypothetical protein